MNTAPAGFDELGDMNLFFVYDDGTLATSASESILESITK